jgi:hypothetical protein
MHHASCSAEKQITIETREREEATLAVLYNHMIRYPLSFLFHSLFHFPLSTFPSTSRHSKPLLQLDRRCRNKLAITSYRS